MMAVQRGASKAYETRFAARYLTIETREGCVLRFEDRHSAATSFIRRCGSVRDYQISELSWR